MGSAESSQSSEMGAIAGLTNQSSFHRQSPNVARLIRSENSSKMEYEFPISDVPLNNSSHHHHHHHHHHHRHHHGNNSTNHSNISSNDNRYGYSNSSKIHQSRNFLSNNENLTNSKNSSNQTSNIWLTLTSCFGCRTRASDNSPMNSLRDKVHAIRIVRASNDLTPAVFDSHYNIITIEQLRECDNNASGNISSLPNDLSDPLTSQNSNSGASTQNGNGSVTSSKKDNSHRMRKKKKKQSSSTSYATKQMDSDDDDDNTSRRT